MGNMTKVLLLLVAVSLAAAVAACGSSGGTSGGGATASTLSIALSENDSGSLQSISKKGAGGIAAKVVDLATYSVNCTDGAGVTYSGTITASGSAYSASVPNIPTGTPLVCYILDSNGVPVTQITLTSSSVLGGQFDAPKLSGDASVTVEFNPYADLATSPEGTATNIATSMSGTPKDITGVYSMHCTNVINLVTAEAHANAATYCADFEADAGSIYVHQVSGTDSSGATVYAAAPWMSQAAFEICGSTEGLDYLPTGFSTVAANTAAFTWNEYFSDFSADSTSEEIADMIVAFGDGTDELPLSYTVYRASPGCGWLDLIPDITDAQKKQSCAIMYYWEIISGYAHTNAGTVCIPQISSTWSSGVATISEQSALASTVTPIGRHQFMPLQFLTASGGGEIGRLSGKESWPFSVYDENAQEDHDCVHTNTILVEWTMPASDPVASTEIPMKFVMNSKVAAANGDSDITTICQLYDRGSEMCPNGYYLNVTMTKQ